MDKRDSPEFEIGVPCHIQTRRRRKWLRRRCQWLGEARSLTGEEGGRKGEKTETGFSEEEGRSETDGAVAAVAGGRRRRREKNEEDEEERGSRWRRERESGI